MVPVFVQPFPLFFACFELHAIFFLAGHPTHESVEVMLARRENTPPLVWAIVTGHDQSQIDYVSDPEVTRALKETRSGTRPVHHAEFELRENTPREGSFATAFTDASGERIELYFDPASEPSSDYAGLIDPGGHSRQSSFPFMWSERAGIGSPESRVRIQGERYEIPVEAWVPFFFTGVRAFRAEGFCLGAIPAGEFEFSVEEVPTALEAGASWRYRAKGGTRAFEVFEKEGDRLLISESDRVSRALGTKVFARVLATDGQYRLDGVEVRSAFAPPFSFFRKSRRGQSRVGSRLRCAETRAISPSAFPSVNDVPSSPRGSREGTRADEERAQRSSSSTKWWAAIFIRFRR